MPRKGGKKDGYVPLKSVSFQVFLQLSQMNVSGVLELGFLESVAF